MGYTEFFFFECTSLGTSSFLFFECNVCILFNSPNNKLSNRYRDQAKIKGQWNISYYTKLIFCIIKGSKIGNSAVFYWFFINIQPNSAFLYYFFVNEILCFLFCFLRYIIAIITSKYLVLLNIYLAYFLTLNFSNAVYIKIKICCV